MGKADKFVELSKEHLNGEEIKYWVFGLFKSKTIGGEISRDGVLVATERQVFFYAKKMIGFETESFPFSNISSLEIGKGFLGHKVTIIASGNVIEMTAIQKGQINEFVEYVRSNIGKKESSPVAATSSTDELRNYKSLLDEGIISQEEFDAKKKQLLGI